MDNPVAAYLKEIGRRFFGTYTGPINLFKSFYQRDLLQYYTTSSPKPLPFGFGYQYNRQVATLILAVRR
jgi:hypothetical protein